MFEAIGSSFKTAMNKPTKALMTQLTRLGVPWKILLKYVLTKLLKLVLLQNGGLNEADMTKSIFILIYLGTEQRIYTQKAWLDSEVN